MKNMTFRGLVTWLLIATPLWWVSGCYTTRDITKAEESCPREIEVVTKSGQTMSLLQGYLDSLGGISGQFIKKDTLKIRTDWPPSEEARDTVRIPCDSIRRVFIGEAVVETHDGNSYRFEDLTLDGLGRLSGIVLRQRPSGIYGEPQIWSGRRFTELPLENARSISVETLNVGLSIGAGVTMASAAFLAVTGVLLLVFFKLSFE